MEKEKHSLFNWISKILRIEIFPLRATAKFFGQNYRVTPQRLVPSCPEFDNTLFEKTRDLILFLDDIIPVQQYLSTLYTSKLIVGSYIINMSGTDAEDSRSSNEETETASQQPVRHECEMPSTCLNMGSKIYYVKLPNFLSIDTREYDPEHYEDEIYDDEVLDNEGGARLKLKVENTIRWRKVNDEVQSNARVVEWSDGTMSLYLGSEVFDVNEKSIGECSHLFCRQGLRQGLQGLATFNSKLSIRPYSTESLTHRKLTLSLADRSQKTQKIRMLNNPGQDPEVRLSELSKREDDKMKATLRRESKQRRIQERSQMSGPSASYLEPDYDEEDEDGAISLSAIKRGAMARATIDDSDDASGDGENEYSDDSDPEFGKIQRRSERKKKQVVEASDEE